MKAAMPSLIRCPHCQNKIRVANFRNFLWLYVPVFLVTGSLLIWALRARVAGLVPLIVIFCGLGAATEFAVSALVVRRADFKKPE